MGYEVEVKYPVTDAACLQAALEKLGVQWTERVVEQDIYFQHPCRDFASTDEALRLREAGGKAFLTYKGRKTDSVTKTRQEIDLPLDLAATPISLWVRLLAELGFRQVAPVVKTRCRGFVVWEGKRIQVCVDDVAELGCFLELELPAEEENLAEAREVVLSLGRHLGFDRSERRSYLELLLEKRSEKFPPVISGG